MSAISTMAVLLVVNIAAPVESQTWVGSKVMIIKRAAEFGTGDTVQARLEFGEVFLVSKVKDDFLWIPRRRGWISKQDVLPLGKVMEYLNAEVRRKPTSETVHQRGLAEFVMGAHDKAIADFDEAIRLDPANYAAFTNRGNAWKAKGDLKKALADYDRAIQKDPLDAAAFHNRSVMRADAGDYANALTDANQALRLNAKFPAAFNNRGVIWREQGEFEKAKTDYEAAIELDPLYAAAYGNRGYIWKQSGEYQRAMEDYQRALRLESDLGAVHNDLAWLAATCPEPAFRNGKLALEHALRACQLNQFKDWNDLDTLAAAHAEVGNFVEAVRWATKAAMLCPAEKQPPLANRLKLYEASMPFRDQPAQ